MVRPTTINGFSINTPQKRQYISLIACHRRVRNSALMMVHEFGYPADMIGMRSIAQRHGLHVIEDAARWAPDQAVLMSDNTVMPLAFHFILAKRSLPVKVARCYRKMGAYQNIQRIQESWYLHTRR